MMHLATKLPSKYKPNLSAEEAEEKRKSKGKGEGKNYYNTKEFKIASKGAYKDWPHPWSPRYRKGDLHTPSNWPRILESKHKVTKSGKIVGKTLSEKMTKEREQTIGIYACLRFIEFS